MLDLFRRTDRGGPAPPGPAPVRLRTGRLQAAASPGGAVASLGGVATAPPGEATAPPGTAAARNRSVRSRPGGGSGGGWAPPGPTHEKVFFSGSLRK